MRLHKSWFFVTLLLLATDVYAGPRERASRLFDRLTGVPLSLGDERRARMEAFISGGDLAAAAGVATDDDNFYNVTLKHWASTLSNRDESPFEKMNDFVAMVIGTVRDNRDARELLSGDFTYIADPALVPTIPAPAADSNAHYDFMETNWVNARKTLARIEPQRADLPDAAGVLTSRAWGLSHLANGTNRRAIAFSFQEFLCSPIRQLQDPTAPDFHVRRDVDRLPGGQAATYLTSCRDCHAGMDALGGAYAHFDFANNQVTYTAGIQGKMTKNGGVYAQGFNTTDDAWSNLWTQNQNAALGWRGALAGQGMKQYGAMLAASEAFGKCMASRVFTQVCRREPAGADMGSIAALAIDFENSGYSLRKLFEEAAALPACLGE